MSTSHSRSDAFLHTAREPRKQRRLDFNNAKQTFDLTQFATTDFGRSRFSDVIDLIVGSKTCGILYPYFRKWRKPMNFLSN